ncbi:hypothetical protein GCM10010269_15250 [Streptomyces humidus]|uniref:Uncharacterized protein n=1 Tax=Streptomyces humidus TaxID=52259 RepID=A0A918FT48_9ACTN|nr:hypothetical protein GCM10010269_15250 [Streptomyces humidus]
MSSLLPLTYAAFPGDWPEGFWYALAGTARPDAADVTSTRPQSEESAEKQGQAQSADLRCTPLYASLVSEWEARGAALPGATDSDWRFVSWDAMDAEVCRTLQNLRLQVPE